MPTTSPSALLNTRRLHRFKAIQAIVEMGLKPVRQAERLMTLFQGAVVIAAFARRTNDITAIVIAPET
ncbi:hypothetical protein [Paraburkholderia sp. PGU19]|uniref:hypothetical protein n=1 Tax=Paraburkholderia sp. PGU19 TaxID=2735434 RepID=UPI0015D992E5|nr:hypothetical protein [Paraburkholderia sp. PGU19]